MKEKERIIIANQSNISEHDLKKSDLIHSDQVVDQDNKEKIKKIFMKKFPDGPVFEKSGDSEPDKTTNSTKKKGSHSLSELHFFQNHHK